MAPPLTDSQKRTDETLDQYLNKWNAMTDSQRTGPDGQGLKSRIVDLVGQRNGPDAAKEVDGALTRNAIPFQGPVLRDDYDERYPRQDAGPAAPAPPAPPAAPPTPQASSSGPLSAEPGDGRRWLPGNASLPVLTDQDNATINGRDADIEAINAAQFKVDPALAWHPEGARLPTGTNISTLGDTYNLARDLIPKWALAIGKLEDAFSSPDGRTEQLIADQHDRIRSAIKTLNDAAAASKDLDGLIGRAGTAANDSFHELRGQELDMRRVMGGTVDALLEKDALENGGGLFPVTPQVRLKGISSQGQFQNLAAVAPLTRANEVAQVSKQVGALATKVPTPDTVSTQSDTAPSKPSAAGAGDGKSTLSTNAALPSGGAALPGGAPVSAGAPVGKGPADKKDSKDDLSKLLSALGSAAPAVGAPAAGPAQAAAPLAKAAQQAAKTPEDLLKSLRGGDKAENAKLDGAEAPAAKAADSDRAAATSMAFTPPAAAKPGALGAPGSNARPHQLDANGKPVDKDHDGKVDKDAVQLSKRTVKPFDLSIPADGANTVVKGVTDPRLGEMMLNMADASGGHPVSVLEAAKSAGMDITSLGDPMDPSQVQVGDAVVGDAQSGIYMGDGNVLTSTGLVEKLDDVLGKDGFVSAIPLPDLPADTPGAPGVDATPPPSAGPPAQGPDTVQVSSATPDAPSAAAAPPTPPTPAPPAPPAAAAAAAPAPAPDAAPAAPPPPPAAPAGNTAPAAAPTGGSGGLPRAVPYQGHALG